MATNIIFNDRDRVVELVQAAQAGDREAFGELFERYERHVFAVALRRNWKTVSSGKLWGGPREMMMPSSVAAAWSSKLKLRQNRLRRAKPQARLIRPPSGL